MITKHKPAAKIRTAKDTDTELGQMLAAAGKTGGTWQPHDFQVRQLALETAARILVGSTSSPKVVTNAAEAFYAFLIGK